MPTASAAGAEGDRDIVQLLRAGELKRAFELLLPRYERRLYRLCLALLRERAQAEDAAQESLVRIWKSLHRYDGRAALSTWIYTITRNRCLTALAQRRSRGTHDADTALESLEDPQPLGGSMQIADAEPAATEERQHREQRDQRLRALVEALPERLRRVLLLYYFEERSVEEVARMLACPEGTVKTQLFRARAALATHLRGLGLHDPRAWLGEDP